MRKMRSSEQGFYEKALVISFFAHAMILTCSHTDRIQNVAPAKRPGIRLNNVFQACSRANVLGYGNEL